MNNLIQTDEHGFIRRAKFTPSIPDGDWIVIGQDAIPLAESEFLYRYVDGAVVLTDIPRRATFKGQEWDPALGNWVDARTLQDHKDLKWIEIKNVRDAVEFGQMVYGGNTYDIDDLSQRRIQGAVQLAGLDGALTMDWTLADNSSVTLTAADIIGLGVALGVHVNAAHVQARTRRASIEAATTVAEVNAIVW